MATLTRAHTTVYQFDLPPTLQPTASSNSIPFPLAFLAYFFFVLFGCPLTAHLEMAYRASIA